MLTLLRKAWDLKTEHYYGVYLGPDRSFVERNERKNTPDLLKKLRNDDPNKRYVLRSSGVKECVTQHSTTFHNLFTPHFIDPSQVHIVSHVSFALQAFSNQPKPSTDNMDKWRIMREK